MKRSHLLIVDTSPSVRFVTDAVKDYLRHYYDDDEEAEMEYDVYTTVLYLVLFAAGSSSLDLVSSMSVGIYRTLKDRGIKLWDVYDLLHTVVYDKRFADVQDAVAPTLRESLGNAFITRCSFRSGFRTLRLELAHGQTDF